LFEVDEWLQGAAESIILHLGQGVERIDTADPGFAAAHPELRLREVKGARNLIAHDYEILQLDRIWSILEVSCPTLAVAIRAYQESAAGASPPDTPWESA
ncbi:MAG: DUF86 domain-containing protein, partial [Propionibacteriaceae bacterium]|nr:DUF86 domain-containing protein [Propionibacteriaceae bacterium]